MVHFLRLTAVSLALVSLVIAGCAKRPATTEMSVPPPAGRGAATSPSQATATTTAPATPPAQQTPATTAQQAPAAPPTGTARPSTQEYVENSELKDIHFDFDKAEIRKVDVPILDADAAWLRSHEDHAVLIEGHCDERGTNEYNVALGDRRAKATMNYLVSRGVPATRITVTSFGEERPICNQHTEACWAKNRRAHFLVKRK
ncbi:MAG: peptidoglycan-associated lipoprotein Pal [Candidatus Rokuibacteriota bacterium]|nr:MAG: peptidoglycan-associated lipoprotein Pal [Candidatus Rokubacteria bacterium]